MAGVEGMDGVVGKAAARRRTVIPRGGGDLSGSPFPFVA